MERLKQPKKVLYFNTLAVTDLGLYVDDKATSDILIAPTEAGSYEIRLHGNYPTEASHLVMKQDITVK